MSGEKDYFVSSELCLAQGSNDEHHCLDDVCFVRNFLASPRISEEIA